MKKINMMLITFAALTTALGFLKKQPIMQHPSDISGDYALHSVPEMAARLRFNADNTFQFMYIYGASDRSAQGTYTVENNNVILRGSKSVGKDFELIEEKVQNGSKLTVSIADENDMLLSNVVVYFINAKDTVIAETNAEGIASVSLPDCEKIQLIHGYFPDEPTTYLIKGNQNNFFQFALKPSLTEVVFDKTVLHITEDSLEMKNLYLFGERPVDFVKE